MTLIQSKTESAGSPSGSTARAWGAVLLAIAVSGAGGAGAQNLERGQGVEDRLRPEYDAMGLRLGTFLVHPAAEFRYGYDDNVLAEDKSKIDDQLFTVAPSVGVESTWERHFLSISSGSQSEFYTDESDETRTDWNVKGTGRLDLLESSDLTLSTSFQNRTEPREAIDAVGLLDEPTEYDQFDASGAINHRFNRASVQLGAGFTLLDYDDAPRVGGGTVDEDFRDRGVLTGIARLGYEIAPGHRAFVRGEINNRDYRKSTPSVAFDRDSRGFEVVAGWASGISNLVSGEVYVGYLDQNYDSSALNDVNGVSFGLDLHWFATELTTITASAARDVVDSTTAGSSGILRTSASIGVSHELMRNLLLDGEFSYYNGDFKGISREDNWYGTTVGVQYLLNRYMHFDVDYAFNQRASNATSLDYQRNQVSMGVKFQY